MLTKVVSGFQTGWDIAAMRAAKAVGIPTGGWMPKGFMTQEKGLFVAHPEYADLYGAKQTDSADFAQRTAWNVRDSGSTLIFSKHDSVGTRCAKRACDRHGREWLHLHAAVRPIPCSGGRLYLFDWENEIDMREPVAIRQYAQLIEHHLQDGGVLNVAGNRLKHFEAPGEAFLTAVFREMRQTKEEGNH